MEILKQQFGEDELWHIQVGGIAADGKYRVNATSVEYDDPETWLAEHQAEAQALVDAGQHDLLRETRPDFDALAGKVTTEIEWLDEQIPRLEAAIPTIDAMTLAELRTYIGELSEGLLRVLHEQREELRAWRYLLRRFG